MPLGLLPDGWMVYYTYNFEYAPAYACSHTGEPLIFLNYNAAVAAAESTLAGWPLPKPQYMWIAPHFGMWINGSRI